MSADIEVLEVSSARREVVTSGETYVQQVSSSKYHVLEKTVSSGETHVPEVFIFSTATDGKIKAWLYDIIGSRVDYNALVHSFTRMAYRTNKEGDSYIVEWNESKGVVKRAYQGLKRSTEF
ncbi:topless-related protein 4 [Artemisia annua]|uniref:Topless-related protein 4 n=1 Tax=Artemisia annua TaxID=35608 RepID=A0A2U1P0H5_ARTAN|nr:topless-related protein 4 [Artemisia annua]